MFKHNFQCLNINHLRLEVFPVETAQVLKRAHLLKSAFPGSRLRYPRNSLMLRKSLLFHNL